MKKFKNFLILFLSVLVVILFALVFWPRDTPDANWTPENNISESKKKSNWQTSEKSAVIQFGNPFEDQFSEEELQKIKQERLRRKNEK